MRAVLDPNVLASAAILPAGPARQIITVWTNERFELIISPGVLDGLADVLARPKFRRFISSEIAVAFIDDLATAAIVVGDPPDPPSVSRDPDADYLIALARSTGADFIVSGDRDLLDLTEPDPPVLTPRQSLDLLDVPSRCASR